jgi:hypothetical protein
MEAIRQEKAKTEAQEAADASKTLTAELTARLTYADVCWRMLTYADASKALTAELTARFELYTVYFYIFLYINI